jgi:hypothetical protein
MQCTQSIVQSHKFFSKLSSHVRSEVVTTQNVQCCVSFTLLLTCRAYCQHCFVHQAPIITHMPCPGDRSPTRLIYTFASSSMIIQYSPSHFAIVVAIVLAPARGDCVGAAGTTTSSNSSCETAFIVNASIHASVPHALKSM